jgi:predicted  nucleic acid-binding Zn-ribbon protein
MLDTIEKLLILQDRDRRIGRMRAELAQIEPERQSLKTRSASANASLDQAKLRVKQIESDRKELELEVGGKQALITKYANQQLQTRKNEEYRALAHEIEMATADIVKIEDREIELMENAETAQKAVGQASLSANDARKLLEDQVAQLDARELALKTELTEVEANREELASAVDQIARSRYERLGRTKGENVVVGVQHGVCGGCHMKLQPQLLVSCRSDKELTTCSNCGRILYYTRDMDLAIVD